MRLLTESKRVTSLLIGLASPKYSIYSNLKLSSDLRKVCDMVRGWGGRGGLHYCIIRWKRIFWKLTVYESAPLWSPCLSSARLAGPWH